VIFYENIFPKRALKQCIQIIDDDNHDLDFLLDNENHYLKNNKDSYQLLPKETTDNTKLESILDTINDDSTNNEDNDS